MNKCIEWVRTHVGVSSALIAFLCTVGISIDAGFGFSKQFLLTFVVFLGVYGVMSYALKNLNARRNKIAIPMAVVGGIILWFGRKIVDGQVEISGFSAMDLIVLPAFIVVLWSLFVGLFSFVDKRSFTVKDIKIDKKSFRKQWLVGSLVMFLIWMPVFLCFFPGFVSNDSAVQISQAVGDTAWSNWHPVLHTLFVAGPVNLGLAMTGDLTAGIALYSICQMVIMAVLLGYIAAWLKRETGKKWIGWVVVALYGLVPVCACYSMMMWKDVIFSGLLAVFVVKLFELVRHFGRDEELSMKKLLMIAGLVIVMAMFRNGAVLIVAAALLGLVVFYKKKRLRMAILLGLVMVIVLLVQRPVFNMLGIAKSPFMESMSVPAQQIGYLAHEGRLTEEQKLELAKYADVEKLSKNYNPMNADYAKNAFYYNVVEEDKFGLVGLWFRLLPSNLGGYIHAYVWQMYYYWYPQGGAWVMDLENNHEEMWMKREYTDISLLGEKVKSVASRAINGAFSSSWLGWMNNVGAMVWGVVIMGLVFVYQKRYRLLIPLGCIAIYVVSLLIASPVSSIFRYVYSLLLVMPVLVILSLCKVKGEKQ